MPNYPTLPSDAEDCGRITDEQLAQRLGYRRARDIRKLIERPIRMNELLRYGDVPRRGAHSADAERSAIGRDEGPYLLNMAQALLICMWSEAPNAAAAQSELLAVFKAFRRGDLQARNLETAVELQDAAEAKRAEV